MAWKLLNNFRRVFTASTSHQLLFMVKNLGFFRFFFYLAFLSRTFADQRTAGKGEGISLTPHYHFHPFHIHLDISWAIIAESSPLHIASSRTRTGNLWFSSPSRQSKIIGLPINRTNV